MRVYRLTVTEVELLTTLELDDGTTHELPEDRQVALTTYLVENHSEDSIRWTGPGLWAYVVAPCSVYDVEGGFYPDQRGTSLGITDLRQVEHFLQDRSHGAGVAAGERRRFWHSTVLPRDVVLADVEVGFRRELSGPLPVRWVPR